MTRPSLLLCLVATTAVAVPHLAAAGTCPTVVAGTPSTGWEGSPRAIPLYVRSDAVFDDAPSEWEIAQSFTAALHELYEVSLADVYVYYAGRFDVTAPFEHVDGAIVVHPTSSGRQQAWPADSDRDGLIESCSIEFYSGDPGPGPAFQMEVMHCLGIGHPEDCGHDYQALMSNANPSNSFRVYDVEALEDLYGRRSSVAYAADLSSDGRSLTSKTPSFYQRYARGPLSACNSYSRDGDLAAFAYAFINWILDLDLETGSVGYLAPSQSLMRPAVACGAPGETMVAWVDQATPGAGAQHLVGVESGGAFTVTPSAAEAEGDGLAATRDPATGRYLLVHDSYGYGPEIRVVGGARVHIDASSGFMFGTPAIACGASAVVGADNCVVAWVNGGWRPTLEWVYGHVDAAAGSFVYGPIRGQSLAVKGSPALAYTGVSANPWLLAFHTATSSVVVYRKDASQTSSWLWSNIAFVPVDEVPTSPTIASRYAATCRGCPVSATYEILFNTSRIY